jgi:hypothetical protein
MKMVRIMAAVGNVSKSGVNAQQNYKFIQGDDVVDAIRTEMVKNNVAMFSRALGYEQSAGTTKNGGTNWHAVVQFEFTLIDAESGETMSGTWYGESIDSSDKSFSKAASMALKYWLMKTFMISAGEPDSDKESPTFERQPRTAQQQLRGNGQQERRIGAKSNENGSNSSAGDNPAISDAKSQEWTATAVTVREDKNKKPYLVFTTPDGKPTLRGRDMLRTAGYDVETWTETNSTYDIVPPAILTVEQNGQFWNVTALKKTEMVF